MRERTPTDRPGAHATSHADAFDWDDGSPAGPWERLSAWLVPSEREARGLVVILVLALGVTATLLVGALRRGGDEAAPDPAVVAAATAMPALEEDGTVAEGAVGGEESDAGGAPATEVVVHVTGEVVRPGLVRLAPGARVGDAVDAAGGLTTGADLARVNLARALVDGEHVHVLAVGEEAPAGLDGAVAGGSDAGPVGGSGAIGSDGRLDVNRATVDELVTLPGIGPAKAAAIIQDRERNGPFARPEDLQRVSGIGAATYARIADLITVG